MSGTAKAPVAIRITRPYGTEEEFLQNEVDTLSRAGVVLVGAQPRPDGAILRFEIVLQNGTPILRGEGRVVGHKAEAFRGEPGLSLRFTRLDSKSKALVDRAAAVREQRRASVAPPPVPVTSPPPVPVTSPPPLPVSARPPSIPVTAPPPEPPPPEPEPQPEPEPEPAPTPADSAPAPSEAAPISSEPPPSLRVLGEEDAPPSVVMAIAEEHRAPPLPTGAAHALEQLRARRASLTASAIDALLTEGRSRRTRT